MRDGIFSSSSLKIIAMICMAIDHFAAAFYMMADAPFDYDSYLIMRNIGRIAFPIFLFLLIEGFHKTHDVKKYMLRLLVFAFISEIPFDLALKGRELDTVSQNVYFELFLIILMLYLIETVKKRDLNKFISIGIFLFTAFISEFIRADYGMYGVTAAVLIYSRGRDRFTKAFATGVGFLFEFSMPLVFLSVPIVYLYNGKRGINLKYLFYAFYPIHLVVIAILRDYVFF